MTGNKDCSRRVKKLLQDEDSDVCESSEEILQNMPQRGGFQEGRCQQVI